MLRSAAMTKPRKNTTQNAPDNPKPIADATCVRRLAVRQRPTSHSTVKRLGVRFFKG
jgi:hypothetical protein